MQLDVSHIVSLFTKQSIIPTTLRSLMEQDGDLHRELILIDDNSKDDTVKVAQDCTKNFPLVTIITHNNNKGPSVRLNEGARLSKAKYVHFLDHDDILPANATKIMYDILEETGADFIYGKWEITNNTPEELLGRRAKEKADYFVSNEPLKTVLNGRFKRMCLLALRDFFIEAGGFDEEVFIQDESLPIRLAAKAKTMVVLDAVVNLVPKGDGNLSDNKTQLNHDRFMAYYNFYKNNKNPIVFKRAISAGWKQKRREKQYSFLPTYLAAKTLPCVVNKQKTLENLREYFGSKKVLRP